MPSIDDLPPPSLAPGLKSSIEDLPPPRVEPAGAGPDLSGSLSDQARARTLAYVERHKDDTLLQKLMGSLDGPDAPTNAGRNPFIHGATPMAGPTAGLAQALNQSALGRTAVAAGQGAVMSALDGKEGESVQDKLDRAKSGAKLSGGIQLAVESLPYVGKAAGYTLKKAGSLLSGEDEAIIGNYAQHTDRVNQIIKESGGDITTASDNVRAELSKGIQKAKGALSGQITAALEKASPEARVPAQGIIERLEAAKTRLNPNYKASAIADIDEMINAVKAQAGENGMLDARGLYETKQFLNSSSSSAYNKGGQIFSRASEAAKAAKDAAAEARSSIKDFVPEIADADAQLSKMHAIEGRLNKNLLAPGTPDGALLAAGSGANPRNAANLRKLEEISGVQVAQRAKDLATARAFANPSLLPKDFTGKAAARVLIGAGVGGAVDGKEGALVGGMLASPMAMKGIINAANVAGKVAGQAGIPQAAQFIRQNPLAAQTIAQLAASQVRRANEENPMLKGSPGAPPQLMQTESSADRQPARGEAKWTASGAAKLGLSSSDAARLSADPKARALLIEASDLAPGSPRLKKIMETIRSMK